MSDVLSQNEIDSLLAALSTGELDVDEIKETGKSFQRVNYYEDIRPLIKFLLTNQYLSL